MNPNLLVATHHPSEPRDLPDSPEDPLGGPLIMYTLKIMHNFMWPGEDEPPWRNTYGVVHRNGSWPYILYMDIYIHVYIYYIYII